MTAAARRGSTVTADMAIVLGGSVAEYPEPPESTDRVVDRIGTDPVGASTSVRQLDSDS